jgi:hypothetical protein
VKALLEAGADAGQLDEVSVCVGSEMLWGDEVGLRSSKWCRCEQSEVMVVPPFHSYSVLAPYMKALELACRNGSDETAMMLAECWCTVEVTVKF